MKIFRTKNKHVNYWLDILLIAGLFAIALYPLIWPAVIRGSSMSPTLDYGDVVLISRIAARFGNFSHGDLVMCRIPIYGHNENMIKRIAGVPGDTVQLIDGAEIILGRGEYFILGDNFESSIDSRYFGPISRNQIFARVLFR